MENTKSLEIVKSDSSHRQRIKLTVKNKPKFIGEIDLSALEGVLIIRKKTEHIYHKLNAIGINYQLLADERLHYKWIKIYCGSKEYISTREYFLAKGRVFQFSRKGFELQAFVPIDELNLETIKKYELKKYSQGNLFDEGVS